MNTITPVLPKIDPKLLAAAPHRLLFFVGASNVLLAMIWWTLYLLDTRFQIIGLAQPIIPAVWMHAIVMQFQVLTPFIFGFLLTVFPRWMGLPALSRWHYVLVGLGLFGGQILTLMGLFGFPHLLILGLIQSLAGWIAGFFFLLQLLWKEKKPTWHAVSAATALTFGMFGLCLVLAYAYTGNARLMFAAIKFGSFGLLLPIYFTVCHRMIPFFASNVIAGYKVFKPLWLLGVFWIGIILHLALELMHGYAWLWIPDLTLMCLSTTLLWHWWSNKPQPILLKVLTLGFAWLPIAMLLYSIQSLWYVSTDAFILGRAPAHALFIGYFGSLLVAMVTRVTQGHSGRPLELGRVAGFAFIMIQLVAMTRVVAELMPDAMVWQLIAAILWLLAFLPWVLRSAWIYLTPRADGQAG